ncbi:MAG TPA: hypothetical protein VFV15_00095 [Moraxellaceae bacterium]|nr:hypothetical protein [Moraxellaceae bacterium]
MSAAQYLEVVQTEDGDVLLRRSDADEAEPLVSLRFSPEVRAMLGDHLNEVALAMLGAGMRATSALARRQALGEDGAPRLLH